MKITKKILILGAVPLLLLSSCSKKLDLKPYDGITDENIFLDIEDIRKGTNGAHAGMSAYSSELYVNALVSDEAKLGPGNSGQGALTFRYQFNSDNTTGGDVNDLWTGHYASIHRVNLVLEAIDKVSGDQTLKDQFRGQLLALRAIAHFYLLRDYGGNYNANSLGVAYASSTNIFATRPRETMSAVMSKIEKDLSDAASLVASITPTASTFDVYINRFNLAAFRSRIALYKGDYQAAIDFANEALTAPNKRLARTQTEVNNIWNDNDRVNSFEKLFCVRYENSASIGTLWGTTGGDIYIAPSDKLVDALKSNSTDFRINAYLAPASSGLNYVFKYRGSGRGGSNPENKVVDLKIMRVADLFLIKAEAYARLATPNLTAGMLELQTLRNARGIAGTVTGMDQQTLLNAILDERFKEFCFEGSRFWDLRRFGKPVNRATTDANPQWRTLDANSPRFLMPIPFDEILTNPNMKQNPGYN